MSAPLKRALLSCRALRLHDGLTAEGRGGSVWKEGGREGGRELGSVEGRKGGVYLQGLDAGEFLPRGGDPVLRIPNIFAHPHHHSTWAGVLAARFPGDCRAHSICRGTALPTGLHISFANLSTHQNISSFCRETQFCSLKENSSIPILTQL